MNNQANARHIKVRNVPNFDVKAHFTEFIELCCLGMSNCIVDLEPLGLFPTLTRVGWIYFDKTDDCDIAVSKIDGRCYRTITGDEFQIIAFIESNSSRADELDLSELDRRLGYSEKLKQIEQHNMRLRAELNSANQDKVRLGLHNTMLEQRLLNLGEETARRISTVKQEAVERVAKVEQEVAERLKAVEKMTGERVREGAARALAACQIAAEKTEAELNAKISELRRSVDLGNETIYNQLTTIRDDKTKHERELTQLRGDLSSLKAREEAHDKQLHSLTEKLLANGDKHARFGRLQSAKISYQLAVQAEPNGVRAETSFPLATTLGRRKEWKECASACLDTIKCSPSHVQALRLAAKAFNSIGDWAWAIACAEEANNVKKSNRHENLVADMHATVPEAYAILGVSQKPTMSEVKVAYRRKLLKEHPDKAIDKTSALEKRAHEVYFKTLKKAKEDMEELV